jgi:hypothetical protein
MRLANSEQDDWELSSGEEIHLHSPETFWIPPLEKRQNLQRGQAVKLIFDIEFLDEEDEIAVQPERMWVIFTERYDNFYIGILDNYPASIGSSPDASLCFGAEIPFLPEHVIDIADFPDDYIEMRLSEPIDRRWPRD